MTSGKDDKGTNELNSDFSADGSEIEIVGEEQEEAQAGASTGSADSQAAALKEELEKAKQDFLYLRAEFDNFKRHSIKERSELIRYGAERLLSDLLDIVDNFERAIETEVTPETLNSFREGVVMTNAELKKVLEKHGVSELDSGVGTAFDPKAHEAMGSEETSEVEPGHISRVFKKAYKLHDKIIRPAQVMVAKEESANNKEEKVDSDNGET